MNLPFRPLVYRSYWESIQGIYKQGAAGFYKGNGVRCLHIGLFHRLNADLNFGAEQAFPEQFKQLKQIPCAPEFLLTCTIDLLLHPLHQAEARFILQNRQQNFALYSSIPNYIKQSYPELTRGILMHLPRNFFIALSKYNSNFSRTAPSLFEISRLYLH